MPSTETFVTSATSGGTRLLVRRWPVRGDEAGGAWASVLLVHGLGEHSGRYEHVGERMAAAGLDVTAYDHRGMGGSDGPRGDIGAWSTLHDDLAERLAAVRAAAAGRPVVLYGHSLGGLICAGYLLTDRPRPDLAVLSSPALDSTIPAWKRTLGQVAGGVLPALRIPNGIDGTTLSRDPSVAARTVGDPRCVTSSTTRFAALGLREQRRVNAFVAGGFGLPTLVLHGEDDSLVPADSSAPLQDAPLVDRRTYPGLRHELHNEPESPEIIDGIIAWLRTKVATAAV
jgi:alpha-beta hydrolase superfamily lysophospholipase